MRTKTARTHRHAVARTQILCWGGCVAPDRCMSEDAHGLFTVYETCRCGALRTTEQHGTATTSTGWVRYDEE